MELNISDEAYFDLEDILQYSIETFGLMKAEEYAEGIFSKISQLSKSPGIGHIHKYLPENNRAYNFEKHIIIYQFSEQENSIAIVRIIHQKSNLRDL
jgi:plasmid stabilization system protein ParE